MAKGDKIAQIRKLTSELQETEENCDDCECISKLRDYITLTHCHQHKLINLRKLSEQHPEKAFEKVEDESDITEKLSFGQYK